MGDHPIRWVVNDLVLRAVVQEKVKLEIRAHASRWMDKNSPCASLAPCWPAREELLLVARRYMVLDPEAATSARQRQAPRLSAV